MPFGWRQLKGVGGAEPGRAAPGRAAEPPEEGVAYRSRAFWGDRRAELASRERTGARPLRSQPRLARVAGPAAFSPPRLLSRVLREPPLSSWRTRCPQLSAPAPLPHRNRSGEGRGGEGVRPRDWRTKGLEGKRSPASQGWG